MPWVCPVCGREFGILGALKRHFMRAHNDGRYCYVCGRKFRKLASHAVSQDDDYHLALAYLVSKSANHRMPDRVHRAVYRVLWVDDVED